MNLLNKTFKSGKYANRTYLDVWNQDRNYLYWMADNIGDYWKNIVEYLEHRDTQLQQNQKKKEHFPTVDRVREIFTLNPILGFDLSEYICELYQLTPDSKKRDYFKSLIERNEIRI